MTALRDYQTSAPSTSVKINTAESLKGYLKLMAKLSCVFNFKQSCFYSSLCLKRFKINFYKLVVLIYLSAHCGKFNFLEGESYF